MDTQALQLQAEAVSTVVAPKSWSAGTRVAFRFCFVYFGLFCFFTQVLSGLNVVPKLEFSDLASFPPMRPLVIWTATHVFHVNHPLVYQLSGSGDKTFDYVLCFCLLALAVVTTSLWTALARKHASHLTLHKWFHLFLRFALAGQMLGYGWAKAVPLQMPFPRLTGLVQPYGNFSPMGILWASIGASPSYEIFAGCAEILGGVLLVIPRTATLGALVCLADMIQVFMLNMTYDVPVKLFSFHLILIAAILLAPDFRRLANMFVLNHPAGPSTQPLLFASPRRNRIALVLQIAFGIVLFGSNAYGSYDVWHKYGGGAPKSPLYGIWNVEQMTIDGQVRSPLLNDYDRWRRAIFEYPQSMAFQRMDDTFARYSSKIDEKENKLELGKANDKNWKATLAYQRPAPDKLVLDGEMDGHKVHLQCQLFDRNKFLLVNRGFHWIQEYPFNR